MITKLNEQCPCYNWAKVSEEQCRNCRGFGGIYDGRIDCKYSEVPNKEPKYKVGEEKYYHEYDNIISKAKIRKIDWDGFSWKYTFARKHTPSSEENIYDTLKDGRERELRLKVQHLYNELMEFKQIYGKLPTFEQLQLSDINILNPK